MTCRDKWRRIEALQRLKSFSDAYREAWELFKAGVRDVVVPVGTYRMDTLRDAGQVGRRQGTKYMVTRSSRT